MKLSRNPNTNWADNRIQFPRLIAEMQADGVFTNEVIGNLAIAMDLPGRARA